jgi:hypothetical protein
MKGIDSEAVAPLVDVQYRPLSDRRRKSGSWQYNNNQSKARRSVEIRRMNAMDANSGEKF